MQFVESRGSIKGKMGDEENVLNLFLCSTAFSLWLSGAMSVYLSFSGCFLTAVPMPSESLSAASTTHYSYNLIHSHPSTYYVYL